MARESAAVSDGGPAAGPEAGEPDRPTGSDGDSGGLPIFVALGVFVLSAAAVPLALVTGTDVTWAVGSNTAAAVAIVSWTARRTYRDPALSVSTVPGAFGTALLVLGGYGLIVGGVLALTGRWHDADGLVGTLAGVGLAIGALGLVTFAFELVFGEPDPADDREGEGSEGPE